MTVTSSRIKSSQGQARQRFPMPGASYLFALSSPKNETQFKNYSNKSIYYTKSNVARGGALG
jgi:hypothetical protein